MAKLKVIVVIPRYSVTPIAQFARMNDVLFCLTQSYQNELNLKIFSSGKYFDSSNNLFSKITSIYRLVTEIRNERKTSDLVHVVAVYPYFMDILLRLLIGKIDIIGPNLIRFPPLNFLATKEVGAIFKRSKGKCWFYLNKYLFSPILDKIKANFLFNNCKFVLSMSDHSRRIVEFLGVEKTKTLVLPPSSFSGSNFFCNGREELVRKFQAIINDNRRVVLFAGRLTEHKGASLLADLIELTSEKRFFYVIVGDGPLSYRFAQLANERSNVMVTGHLQRTELVCLYRLVDIYVQPTYEEQLSVTVIESLQEGTPVICSDHPSFLNVGFGRNIKLFKLGDIDDFRSALEEMDSNYQEYKDDSVKGSENYDIHIAAKFLLNIYRQCL